MSGRWWMAMVALVGAMTMSLGTASASADTLSASCSWGGQSHTCDSTTWYPSAVTLTWQASPAPDSSSCSLGIANHYNTDTVKTVSCSATWGTCPSCTTISQQYMLHVETSSPTVTAAATRAPDANGWYNSPVTINFQGTSFSGMASCTSATYAGPDTAAATVSGSCTDNAGKTVGATSPPFAYDGNPSLTVTTRTGDRTVLLRWASADVAPLAQVKIVRSPGLRGKRTSVVYRGQGTHYRDVRVRNGVRYRYTLQALDLAGNTIVRTVTGRPRPRLLAPAAGARLNAPPLLRWTSVRGASYYNVQLYRGRKKVLSAWPARSRLQLARRWTYRGRQRLRPGHYRWYVWPGFGRRAASRYGREIGRRMFVIVRPG